MKKDVKLEFVQKKKYFSSKEICVVLDCALNKII